MWGVEVCVCVCVGLNDTCSYYTRYSVCVCMYTYVKVCLNDTKNVYVQPCSYNIIYIIIYMEGSVYTVFVYVCVRGYNSCSITNTHSAYT